MVKYQEKAFSILSNKGECYCTVTATMQARNIRPIYDIPALLALTHLP